MALTVGHIEAIAELKDKLTPAVGTMDSKLKRASGSAGKSFAKIAKVGGAALLGVGAAAAVAGAKLFSLGSDAAETGNKFSVVFGAHAEAARAKLAALRDIIPATTQEMEKMASGTQDLLVPLGLTRGAAADMSLEFVGLAGDLASFNNSTPEQVLNDIKSALVGSSEPMQKYGVDTRVAALEQVALEAGLIGANEEMSHQTRAQAVLLAITKNSTDAIGDAARTSKDNAQMIRFMKVEALEAATTVGTALQPAFNRMLVVGGKLTTGFAALATKFAPLITRFAEGGVKMDVFTGYLTRGKDVLGVLIDIVKSVWQWLTKLVMETGLAAQATVIFNRVMDGLVTVLQIAWNILKPLVGILVDGLAWVLKYVIVPVLGAVITIWDTLIAGLEKGYNWIARLVPGLEEVGGAGSGASTDLDKLVDSVSGMTVEAGKGTDAAGDFSLSLDTGAIGASIGPSAVGAKTKLDVLSSGITVLDDRIKAAKYQTRNLLNALIGGQGLTNGFQQAAAGANLASTQIGHDWLVTLPTAVKTGNLEIIRSTTDAARTAADAWATNFFGTISRAFEGGGGLMGGLKSLVTQSLGGLFSSGGGSAGAAFVGPPSPGAGGLLGGLMGKFNAAKGWLQQGVQKVMNFVPIVGPLLAAFGGPLLKGIGKLAGKVWGGLKRIFGGPGEAQLLARQHFENFRKTAVDKLGQTEAFAKEVARAVADGWDQSNAEARAAFILTATQAGVSYDAAFAHYGRYEGAVKAGNNTLMREIDTMYAGWEAAASDSADAATAAFDESTVEIIHDAEEIGRQFQGLSTEEAAELGAALLELGSKANRAFTAIHDSARAAGAALANDFLPHIYKVRDAIESIPRNVRIKASVAGEGLSSLVGRQHGGPVAAGQAYRVGEGGEELFVPRTSGTIVPNGGFDLAGIEAAVRRGMESATVRSFLDGRDVTGVVADQLGPTLRQKGYV